MAENSTLIAYQFGALHLRYDVRCFVLTDGFGENGWTKSVWGVSGLLWDVHGVTDADSKTFLVADYWCVSIPDDSRVFQALFGQFDFIISRVTDSRIFAKAFTRFYSDLQRDASRIVFHCLSWSAFLRYDQWNL